MTLLSAPWKRWKPIAGENYIAPFPFSSSIQKEKSYCKNGHSVNITVVDFGPTPVAVTRNREKKWKTLPAEDSRKKWESISSRNMRINLFIKPFLIRTLLSMNTIMFTKQRSTGSQLSIKLKLPIGNLLIWPG